MHRSRLTLTLSYPNIYYQVTFNFSTKYHANLLELTTENMWGKTIPRLTPNAHLDANCPIWFPTGGNKIY